MMKKSECEPAIRHLARAWANTKEQPPGWHPCFGEFKSWLQAKGFGHYLNFRSVMPASDVAEQWFDQELGQTWRN
ncbi:hypothetical protein [Pseudomonas sp. ESBL1]|uniref:hypothetical protein n=1 Tax=Pseudomonas sp. ESBL1 TaxID=3077324 RepID=UPI002FC79564